MTIKGDRQTKGSLSLSHNSRVQAQLAVPRSPQLGPLTQHSDIGGACTMSPILFHSGRTPQFFLLPEAWWVLQLSPLGALLPVLGNP